MLNFIGNYFVLNWSTYTHMDTQATSVLIKIRKGHCEGSCNNHEGSLNHRTLTDKLRIQLLF